MSVITFDPAPLLAIASAAAFREPGKFTDTHRAPDCAWERWPKPQVIAIAEVLGVSPGTATRYLRGGRLRENVADRLAIRLGLHPSLIWTEWYA